MLRNWKSVLKADPPDWLLENRNPCVGYFTLRDILDCSQNSPEAEKAKENINSYEKVVRIFRKQKPEGYWESDEQPYDPKYKSIYARAL